MPNSESRLSLDGKYALVTGAAGLLGKEHCTALLKSNATVVMVDKDPEHLERARQEIKQTIDIDKLHGFCCDITDESAMYSLRDKLTSNHIEIDILVNNAAINPKMNESDSTETPGKLENYPLEALKMEINVGVIGALICARVFGERMAENNGGSIINVASDLAILAPDHRIYSDNDTIEGIKGFKPVSYSIVKSAMLGLNRYLATYWAHKGIRSNCLVPGGVFNNQPDYLTKNLARRVPLNRWALKHEYQEAIVFLASDASSYMTGQELIIDGGRSAW